MPDCSGAVIEITGATGFSGFTASAYCATAESVAFATSA